MSNLIPIKLCIRSTDVSVPLHAKVCLDDTVLLDTVIMHDHVIECSVEDGEHTHKITVEMQGKLPEHTKLDETGNIVKDAMIVVSDVSIDDIDLNVNDVMTYLHDTNGSAELTQHKFYGNMGCNGVATFEFSTPIYIWLLENM
jgi:hypothetical protein